MPVAEKKVEELRQRIDTRLRGLKDQIAQRVADSSPTTPEQIQAIQIEEILHELAVIRVTLEVSIEALWGRR